MIMEKAKEILRKPVCDHCLGRQFAQLLSGTTNEKRGKALRTAAALSYEETPFDIEKSNFADLTFRKQKLKAQKKPCSVCGNIFEHLPKIAKMIITSLTRYEFDTFVVGTKMSNEMIQKEESFWEEFGIDTVEPIKEEINRELGKLIAAQLHKTHDESSPDITILFDLRTLKAHFDVGSVYVYGEYQKLMRGIPQTKWSKYKITVEDIIAKPFMKSTKSAEHAFHGVGREDIDARCLAWRPFIFEVKSPKIRTLKLKEIEKAVNKGKKVKIRNLKPVPKSAVAQVKSWSPDKTYQITAILKDPLAPGDLKKIKSLQTMIKQKTPNRVLHRRSNKTRPRRVKSISAKKLSSKRLRLTIHGEAGLYVKELLTGDDRRTKPSLAQILGTDVVPKDLDVVRIHLKNKLKK